MMFWTKAKLVAGCVAAAIVVSGGAGIGLHQVMAAEEAGGAPTAGGRTLVVDQAHPRASDSNPGTPRAPWKTVSHAAKKVRPGDTVCVMEGKYDERPTLEAAGAEGSPITFRALPRRSVVIQGFGVYGAYIRLEGFKVTSPSPSKRTTGISIAKGAHHVEVLDGRFEDIFVALGGSGRQVRVAYNKFYRTQFGIMIGNHSKDGGGEEWLVENNDLERQFMHGAGDCDYMRAWGQKHLVRYNRFHSTFRKEVGRAHLDCLQSYNIAKRPHATLHHLTFEHNFCSHFSQTVMIGAKPRRPGAFHHMTFRNNIIWKGDERDNPGAASALSLSPVSNAEVHHNTFVKVTWQGVRNSQGENSRVTNNLFHGLGIVYEKGKGFVGQRNLVFNCKRSPRTPSKDEVVRGDPKLADPAQGNFRLRPGSAAMDAGTNGADIGAFEYPNVYYVDPRHPGASDEGFGYPAWPYKTVAKALSVASARETVVLRGGVYREFVKPKRGVTIRAMKDEKVVVSGADLVAGWKREGNNWSAPLAAKPVRLLRDGKLFRGFTYDGEAKRITVSGFDPRLHLIETVVRKKAIGTAPGAKIEGLEATDTLE